METKHFFVAGVAAALILCSSIAMADRPGQDWIPISKVISIMQDQGYTQISKVEADDGRWEGEGMKDGKVYEIDIDPTSGKVIREKLDN